MPLKELTIHPLDLGWPHGKQISKQEQKSKSDEMGVILVTYLLL